MTMTMKALYVFISMLIAICFASNNGKHLLNVTVKNVSATSVSLHWTSNHFARHFRQLKVSCHGEGTYTDSHGQVLVHRSRKTDYYSVVSGYGMLTNLKPHMYYKCMLAMSNGNRHHRERISFYSQVGAPAPPNQPYVTEYNENGHYYKVTLYNTSTLNGPINGYEIQFRVVDEDMPIGEFVSIDEAQLLSMPTSFIIPKGTEASGPLPKSITIDKTLLSGALKEGSSYVVVVAAYSYNEKKELLFTYSKPSKIIRINAPSRKSITNSAQKWFLGKYILYIGACAILIGIFFLMCGCCLCCRLIKSKKRHTKRERKFNRLAIFRRFNSPKYRPLKETAVRTPTYARTYYSQAQMSPQQHIYQQSLNSKNSPINSQQPPPSPIKRYSCLPEEPELQSSPQILLSSLPNPLKLPPSPSTSSPLPFPDLLSEYEQGSPPSSSHNEMLLVNNDPGPPPLPPHSQITSPLSDQNYSLTAKASQINLPAHIQKTFNSQQNNNQIDEGIEEVDNASSDSDSILNITLPVDLSNRDSSGIVIDHVGRYEGDQFSGDGITTSDREMVHGLYEIESSLPYITARSSPEPPSSNVPQPYNIKVVPKFMFYRTSTATPSLLSIASSKMFFLEKNTDNAVGIEIDQKQQVAEQVSNVSSSKVVTYVYKPGSFFKNKRLKRHSSDLFKRKYSAVMANSDENLKSVSFSTPSSFTKKGTSIINVGALKRALTGESSEESKVGRNDSDNLTSNESNESFYSVKSHI